MDQFSPEPTATARLFAMNSVLALAVLFAVTVLGCSNRPALAETERRGNRIVAAIELYHQQRGEYPESLDVLVPDYIDELPLPTWGVRKWYYRRATDDYTFGVNETTRTGDGASRWFRYMGTHGWQMGD